MTKNDIYRFSCMVVQLPFGSTNGQIIEALRARSPAVRRLLDERGAPLTRAARGEFVAEAVALIIEEIHDLWGRASTSPAPPREIEEWKF